MLAANRPEIEYRLVVVKRPADRGRVARLRVIAGDGTEVTLSQWEWLSGRPDVAQLADMLAVFHQELEADLVTRYGAQVSLLPPLPSGGG